MPVKARSVEERFWPKVKKTEGCWLWMASKTPFGYGRVRDRSYKCGWTNAHRASWQIHHGEIPAEMFVLHKCDNPACVNPDHLFLGTQKDNLIDMASKGRANSFDWSGEKSPTCKLSADVIVKIRSDPRRQVDIAADFGITQAQVSKIKRRANWAHIP